MSTRLPKLLVDETEELELAHRGRRSAGAPWPRRWIRTRAEDLTTRIALSLSSIVRTPKRERCSKYSTLPAAAGGDVGGSAAPAGARRREGRLPELENGGSRRGKIKEDDVADKRTIPSRRRHLFQLISIRRGLEGDSRQGVDGIITVQGAKVHVDPIVTYVSRMIDDLQDVETTVQQLGAKLTKSRRAIMPMIPANLGAEDEVLDAAEEATETVAGGPSRHGRIRTGRIRHRKRLRNPQPKRPTGPRQPIRLRNAQSGTPAPCRHEFMS